MNTTPDNQTDSDGPEKWVPEAIAEQQEYLKRVRGCNGQPVNHAYRDFGVPSPDGTIRNDRMYRACVVCGVTESPEDYHRKLGR
jgi:hypothetical protein